MPWSFPWLVSAAILPSSLKRSRMVAAMPSNSSARFPPSWRAMDVEVASSSRSSDPTLPAIPASAPSSGTPSFSSLMNSPNSCRRGAPASLPTWSMACCRVKPARSALAICCSASASCPLKRATRRRRKTRSSRAGAKNPATAAAAAENGPPTAYPSAASTSKAQRLSRRICRGSMKRNMALRSRTDRARYLSSYSRNAFRTTSNASQQKKNAEAPARRRRSRRPRSRPPRRDRPLAVPADDLDGPVALLLQLAGAVSGEEHPLVDDAALLLRVEIVGIAQEQRERPELLRQREHLRLLREGEHRHRREALLLLRHGGRSGGEPPGGEHHHVLQQGHGAQLLGLGVAEAPDHVDVVVRADPEPHRLLLLDVDADGAPLRVDERRELGLARALEVADEDGIARLERHEQALPDRALQARRSPLVHLHVGIGDEARRDLANRDHLGRKL